MKKLVIFALLGISSLAVAQKATSYYPISDPRVGVEIRFDENNDSWSRLGYYSHSRLIALLSKAIKQSGLALGLDTRKLLEEGDERDQLVLSHWVKDSPRLKPHTLLVNLIRLDVSTGGSYTATETNVANVSYQGANVGIEADHGQSTATITIVITNLITGDQITVDDTETVSSVSTSGSLSAFFRNGLGFNYEFESVSPAESRSWKSTGLSLKNIMPKLTAELEAMKSEVGP